MRLTSALVLLLLGATAQAACPANVLCVSWSASTKFSDGSAFPPNTVVVYRVWLMVNGKANRLLHRTESPLRADIKDLALGNRCVAVEADAAGGASLSNIVCKTLRLPAPTEGSIEAPTEGSIEEPKR